MLNLTPMATEKPWLAPRLEGWVAVADIMGIPQEERRELFDRTRGLHALVNGYVRHIPEIFKMDYSEMAELPEDEE